MDATTSISKGCFAFVPSKTKQNKSNDHSVIFSQPWYKAYKNIWSSVKNKIQKLNKEISESIVNDVVNYVAERNFECSHIQTAILFTGINLPDHDNLYEILSSKLKHKLGCYISVLSPNYTTVKAVIENMVFDFVNSDDSNIMDGVLTDSDEESSVNDTNKIKKSECNMQYLLDWYNQLKPSKPYKCSIKLQDGNEKIVNKPPLVIIMGDLEMYDVQVLRRFLLILRIYVSEIPIVLIFGVATTLSMIHRSLSHQIISKLVIRIFQSQSSLVFLNSILEKIFFTSQCPFQLSGAVFKYLTDTFLLYDFSVSTFIKGMQFAIMDHFYYSDVCVLCTDASSTAKTVKRLKRNQIQEILELPSVIAYNDFLSRNNLPTLNESDNIKNEITVLLNNFHSHTSRFHLAVRCLHSLVADLPQAPLGKHIREIYVEAMQTSVVDTPEFKNCFNLLAFFSKDEFLEKLNALIVLFTTAISDNVIVEVLNTLNNFKEKIISSDLNKIDSQSEQTTVNVDLDVKNRAQLRQKLLENFNRGSRLNEYEQLRKETLHYLSQEVFKLFLKSPKTLPLHEIFIYDNASMVCAHLDGKPRSIIQTALQNPHRYLECHCCKSDNKNGILKTMPDTCIAYKLHLECGTLINLYDWLQSFAAVVDCKSTENDDRNEGGENYISPEIQARFWQSVSELQLEGFIQRTKRKVDHVERLTFDGN